MSELDEIMGKYEKGSKGKSSTAPDPSAEGAEDGAEHDADKSDYDYLLGMNLWSLTFEKVEEIKKQHEIKVEELKVLEATTIESMWDRDLDAVSKCLDEIDAAEADEDAQAAAAAEGRRKKDGARKAAAPAPRRPAPMRKRTMDDDMAAEDKKLAKSSLVAGADLGADVQKTTWGTGAAKERSRAEGPIPEAGPVGALVQQKRKRAPGSSREAADEPPPPEPVKEDGGSLLSRLLNKTATPAASSSSTGSSLWGASQSRTLDSGLSSHSSLSGSSDFFSYLKGGSSSLPAPLEFGAPPGIGSATPAAADDNDDDEAKGDAAAKKRKKAAKA